MQHRVILLLLLALLIGISYAASKEYFANPPLKNGDTVRCKKGGNPNTLYQYNLNPDGTATLNIYGTKAIAYTYDASISWDHAKQPVEIDDCSNAAKYTIGPQLPANPLYKAPTLVDGDIVACVSDPNGMPSDTLYKYIAATKTLQPYVNFLTALAAKSTAATPKVITKCAGYTIGKIIYPLSYNGKTVKCMKNDPNKKGSSALYQFVNDSTLNYYVDENAAHIYSGRLPPVILQDCSTFSVDKTLDSTSGSGSGDYGTQGMKDAQLGKKGAKVIDPISGKEYSSNVPAPSRIYGPGGVGPEWTWPDSDPRKKDASAATPSRTDITPEVAVSDIGYDAMNLHKRSSLLRDIQRIVHNELRASRNTSKQHPMAMCEDSVQDDNCDSVEQGNEYKNSKIDMAEYIKKDAIPCWGCNLDY